MTSISLVMNLDDEFNNLSGGGGGGITNFANYTGINKT